MDDLDRAEDWIVDGEYAKAAVHIRLWYAKQHRAYQRAQEDLRAKQAAMPIPPPIPPAMPFPGAF